MEPDKTALMLLCLLVFLYCISCCCCWYPCCCWWYPCCCLGLALVVVVACQKFVKAMTRQKQASWRTSDNISTRTGQIYKDWGFQGTLTHYAWGHEQRQQHTSCPSVRRARHFISHVNAMVQFRLQDRTSTNQAARVVAIK